MLFRSCPHFAVQFIIWIGCFITFGVQTVNIGFDFVDKAQVSAFEFQVGGVLGQRAIARRVGGDIRNTVAVGIQNVLTCAAVGLEDLREIELFAQGAFPSNNLYGTDDSLYFDGKFCC